jgi:hypothetical protein
LERYQHTMNDFFRLYAGKPPHTNENKATSRCPAVRRKCSNVGVRPPRGLKGLTRYPNLPMRGIWWPVKTIC